MKSNSSRGAGVANRTEMSHFRLQPGQPGVPVVTKDQAGGVYYGLTRVRMTMIATRINTSIPRRRGIIVLNGIPAVFP